MAAMFALQNDKKFLEDWLKKFNERKNFLINFFNSMEGLKAFKPDGAFYLYVSCEGLINKKYGTNKIINDFDFCKLFTK